MLTLLIFLAGFCAAGFALAVAAALVLLLLAAIGAACDEG